MDLILTEHGFLVNSGEWNEGVALELAKRNAIELTPAHWEIVLFMRAYYTQFHYLLLSASSELIHSGISRWPCKTRQTSI